jgi:voltage-gated potassium channel
LSIIVSYRLLRILRKLAINRIAFLLVFFLVAWLASSILFYWSEHIHAGREDVDFETSLYWALITMATVGYGDVTPSRGIGWAVAGIAAVFGISVYTLFISTIADRFLEATVKASMGLGKLRGKQIIVIGQGPICEEAVKELVANDLVDETGWVMNEQPKGSPPVDFIVGDLSENTLRRAGIESAERVIICYEDDSSAIHATALVKKVNPNAHITVLVKDTNSIQILEMLGAETIIPISILGRLLASGGFEPEVVKFIRDATSAADKGLDLGEEVIVEEQTVEGFEQSGRKVVAIYRGEKPIVPRGDIPLKKGDRVVYLRQVDDNERSGY